jgi:hypothetical protein
MQYRQIEDMFSTRNKVLLVEEFIQASTISGSYRMPFFCSISSRALSIPRAGRKGRWEAIASTTSATAVFSLQGLFHCRIAPEGILTVKSFMVLMYDLAIGTVIRGSLNVITVWGAFSSGRTLLWIVLGIVSISVGIRTLPMSWIRLASAVPGAGL